MIRVASFGGCPLLFPLHALRREGLATHLAGVMGFTRPPFALSSGAAVQLLRFCRGDLEIPERVRKLCYADPAHVPTGSQCRVLGGADLALVEMSTPIEVVYRGFVLNNNRLKDRFLAPLRRKFPKLEALAYWRSKGLQKRNDAARAQAVEEILANLPPDSEDNLFARDLIELARVRETKTADIVADLHCLQTELPLPLGIILHNFNYMPDGRPISWPADFRANCLAAAKELGVPVYDPAALVASYGATAALTEDMRHYSHEFWPVIGHDIYRELIVPLANRRKFEREEALVAEA